MYEQVMARIKERIAVGDWPPGTKLPSIRELAVALKVSVITIKRAYQELEQGGDIVVQQGKGCFVAEMGEDRVARNKEEIEHHLRQAVTIAGKVGMSPQELEARLKEVQDSVLGAIE